MNDPEVSVPGVALGDASKSYSTGLATFAGDSLQYNELSISFIVDESLNNWREIYNWMRGLAPASLGEDNQYSDLKMSDYRTVSDASLILLTNTGNPNIKIDFKDMFPLSLSDIGLKLNDTSVEPVSAQVTFRYTYMNFTVVESVNPTSVEGNVL